MFEIVIIGEGPASVAVTSALTEPHRFGANASITVISPSGLVGPGKAFGISSDRLQLNSRSQAMSIGAGRTFLDWCRENRHPLKPYDFAQRTTYGAYLADEFARLQRQHEDRIRVLRTTAIDVEFDGGRFSVDLADGTSIDANAVVMAIGPPSSQPLLVPNGLRVVQDPWASHDLEISEGSRVLLVGTGLTMIDVALRIGRDSPGTHMVARSRSGLLPTTHEAMPVQAPDGIVTPRPGTTLSDAIRLFRSQTRGASWQGTVDSWRPATAQVWEAWSETEQDRFQRHVARHWEIHRHRVSPQTAEEFQALIEHGLLSTANDAPWTEFDVVVNCTGPAKISPATVPQILTKLIARGLAHLDHLELGVVVDPESGRIANGRQAIDLFAVGALRRGTSWETTAIPEIRNQAQEVARAIGSR